MRFLGVGDYCDLSALYLRLAEEGHEVKVFIGKPNCQDVLNGLIDKTNNWKEELAWVRGAGESGVLLFESVTEGNGALQDQLRLQGFNVVGGSALGDRLENDRAFGQSVLRERGLSVAGVWEFRESGAALDFLARNPGRYVLKFNAVDTSHTNFVGRFSDGRDVRAMLTKSAHLIRPEAGLVLMEYIEGVEMGVGAYFDGDKFLAPACLDWEHKRFFPGDLGELTGEMGTVVTYERSDNFFERTLGRIADLLREHKHCGYVNLNTVVNAQGIWPLEFTCRFGYPGFAILTPLQAVEWGRLLASIANKTTIKLPTYPGFCAGIVLTTPPFPYSREQLDVPVGLPVMFEPALSKEERGHVHYCELAFERGELVTAGAYGWAMVVTGTGDTISQACLQANALAKRVAIPNLRYRKDIGQKLVSGDYQYLQKLGCFG